MIALPDTIRLIDGADHYPLLLIDHPLCSARIALHGAHLMEWTPRGFLPVIYLSPTAVLREGKAIRGGVPICWPWFGAHPNDSDQPAHGLVRNKFWELAEASSTATGVRLYFRFADHDSIRSGWNHPCELTLEMLLGTTMELRLRTRNTGEESFTIAGALHSYFRVSNVSQTQVQGLEDAMYTDTTSTPWERKQQHGSVMVWDEVDRIYDSTSDVTIEDAQLKRRIIFRKQGSASTIVWNPGPIKAATLGDLPTEDVAHFICIEAANANDTAVTVDAGTTHTLSMRVSVQRY